VSLGGVADKAKAPARDGRARPNTCEPLPLMMVMLRPPPIWNPAPVLTEGFCLAPGQSARQGGGTPRLSAAAPRLVPQACVFRLWDPQGPRWANLPGPDHGGPLTAEGEGVDVARPDGESDASLAVNLGPGRCWL